MTADPLGLFPGKNFISTVLEALETKHAMSGELARRYQQRAGMAALHEVPDAHRLELSLKRRSPRRLEFELAPCRAAAQCKRCATPSPRGARPARYRRVGIAFGNYVIDVPPRSRRGVSASGK